jgi:hypothetical protein
MYVYGRFPCVSAPSQSHAKATVSACTHSSPDHLRPVTLDHHLATGRGRKSTRHAIQWQAQCRGMLRLSIAAACPYFAGHRLPTIHGISVLSPLKELVASDGLICVSNGIFALGIMHVKDFRGCCVCPNTDAPTSRASLRSHREERHLNGWDGISF